MTIPQDFALALQHHQAGRLEAAEQIYRRILNAVPDHADALHAIGSLYDNGSADEYCAGPGDQVAWCGTRPGGLERR